jgi:UDP-glucose 4-epimerase
MVAITGAAGAIGRGLVGLLEQDPMVDGILALDRVAHGTSSQKTSHHQFDPSHPTAEERLTDLLGDSEVDTLVHLDFLSLPSPDRDFGHELESVGTMRVLGACRRTLVGKLVMWSQTLLYGASPTNPNFLAEQHPLRARRDEPFFADKLDAERDVQRFGLPGTGRIVTILRTAPLLGAGVQNLYTRYLSHRVVPTVLGFDPLWQFLHEADAVRGFRLAVLRDRPGVFNLAADGVVPLSAVLRLAGRASLPLPRALLKLGMGALRAGKIANLPPAYLDYLQYLCVADNDEARRTLGFVPTYTTRQTLLDFVSAQRLRDLASSAEQAA